ncbi:MAG TPA: SusD/RagB family nutrient-binding outer membrane lipoprotein [Bacteroidales bacterium]|nr:SusD/RagB family nutrient-binding outer membrane lipoprotein [Bacteroidales bacterium]
MKKFKIITFMSAFLLLFVGCDKGFDELALKNQKYTITDLDPGMVFAGSQRVGQGNGWESEATVVQYFELAYNLGATAGFNFNYDVQGQQNAEWGNYTGTLMTFKNLLEIIDEKYPERTNLKSVIRIWRAFVYMNIVDKHGDVPYFDALRAAEGPEYWRPKYDDAQEIYNDLEKEIREAVAALDPNKDFLTYDVFFGPNGYNKTTNAADQVAKWKKVGNSLLLRMALRYSKLNPTKGAALALEAFNAGVMTSNDDNVMVTFTPPNFSNGRHANLVNPATNPYYYYAAEPFVNQLKNTQDPRSKYIIAKFDDAVNPQKATGSLDWADQFGVPVGVPADVITDPANAGLYRGKHPITNGLDYSQMNVQAGASTLTPQYWLMYSQVSLNLAEAAFRGWIPGGDAQAQVYYENAIKADMDRYELIATTTLSSAIIPFPTKITDAEKATYLAHPLVAWNSADALKLINTQYWVVNIWDPREAWYNWRRSGYPVLERNKYNDNFLLNGGDGFVHRYRYTDAEYRRNKVNVEAAAAKIGGDFVTTRVFWDVQ